MRWADGGSMLGGGRVARAKLLDWVSVAASSLGGDVIGQDREWEIEDTFTHF